MPFELYVVWTEREFPCCSGCEILGKFNFFLTNNEIETSVSLPHFNGCVRPRMHESLGHINLDRH